MASNRWREISHLYHAALEHPSKERDAFLEGACHGDESLRHEIQSLLAQHTGAQDIRDAPAVRVVDALSAVTVAAPSHGLRSAAGAGGYAPGTLLGDRFRIIGLLGVGGMGEVYRADDLKLGQPVALKFLPAPLSTNAEWLARFYTEVRMARQVSHPYVCRVYDVDEIDGRHFLSMEYIDGENLASLLTRIGHLARGKLLEVAHHLCAGLAAAHRKGVLHRDLKPANVMIDGRGHARLMDFGLAVSTSGAQEVSAMAGTPVYMAPEQLAGQGASVGTDIYALGLILYEACTGRQLFDAKSLSDLRLQKEGLVPTPPSEIVHDVDPDVERLILKCIDREPRGRPTSVSQLAAALPGGGSVVATLSAGDTPSPEMVAAWAGTGGLSTRTATALVAGLVLCTAGTVWLGADAVMTRRVPLARPPAASVERARQIVEQAGYPGTPADSAFGVAYNDSYLQFLAARDHSAERWKGLSDQAIRFWYRQSPQPLHRLAFSIGVNPTVTPADPRLAASGEVLVTLDGRGRLVDLVAVPPAVLESSTATTEFDWTSLFRSAGVDPAGWQAAVALWTPAFAADRTFAWRPPARAAPDSPVRIEAASFHGRPTQFQVVYAWDGPGRVPGTNLFSDRGVGAGSQGPGTKAANLIGIALTAVAMFGGVVIARRNLRLGRGDRRGASRLALFVVGLLAVAWLLDEHHVADTHEWYLLLSFAGRALVIGGLFWSTYVAFEPYVRRHWPSKIVSWSRLLTGGVRDPLVGRDVVIGCVAGALLTNLVLLAHLVPGWLGLPAEWLVTPTWHAWLGPSHAVSLALQLVCNALLEAFVALFVLVLIRTALGREYLAALLAAAVLALPDVLLSQNPGIAAGFFFTIYLLGVLLLMRVGLLAVIALRFCVDLLQAYPIVPDLSTWYAGLGTGAILLLGAIIATGVRLSLSRPLASRPAYGPTR